MKRYVAFCSIVLALGGCAGALLGPVPDATSPGAVYDQFWQTFDQNYTGFAVRNVDWDSVYQAHRPLVTDQTSPKQLLDVMAESIRVLRDGHVAIQAPAVGVAQSFTFVQGENFPGVYRIRQQYAPALQILSRNVVAGDIRPQVGYLYLATFANDPGFAQLDAFFDRWRDYKAIIIDIRDNNGGNDANGSLVAGRLVAQRTLYRYVQWRTGPRHTDLSDHEPIYVAPRGAAPFTKPVYLLTNRYVFSAGNGFVMMLRALPNVTQIGDVTGDGVAGPIMRELGNGWNVAVPSKLESLPSKEPVEGRGIRPHIFVLNDNINRDRILETALELAENQ